MEKIVKFFIDHFTTIGWFGWYEHNQLIKYYENIGIISLIFIGIILFFNTCYFLYKIIDENDKIIFLDLFLLFSYLIINCIIQIIFVCLFISIGALGGFIVLGILYIILLCVNWGTDLDEYDHLYGIFNIMGFFIDYSIAHCKFRTFKKDKLQKYNALLNLNY